MINVFDSAKILCQSAMEIFIGLAKKNIAQKGSFAVALSGGSTPNLMYDLLAQKENAKRINWEKLFIFWGDERYISYNSKDNNAFQAKSHLLDLVPIPQNNIFRIPVSGDYRNDALHYEEGIKKFFNANLRRLIDNQQEFIRAFEEIVRRPNEQEAVLRAMAVRCLAPGAI